MLGDLFAAPAAARVGVALPLPVDSLFDYAVPAELDRESLVGCRVLVPVESRLLVGIVVERSATGPSSPLRFIESVLDPKPVLSAKTLRLLREEATRVLCPIGVALATALPPGSNPRTREMLELTPRGREALQSGALRGSGLRLAQALADGPRGRGELERSLGGARSSIPILEADRLILRGQSFSQRGARAKRERVVALAAKVEVEKMLSALKRAPKQAEVLRWVAAEGPLPVAELEGRHPGASRAVAALAKRGWVELCERLAPLEAGPGFAEDGVAPTLTGEQREALEVISAAVENRRSERFLLHGVTGSGKTEVYLRAIDCALRAGRQALMLVPEITLTHQIVARTRARFGERVSVLHSGLSPGTRLAQWERLSSGSTPIAVGARSALFAPLEDLGLVVVDEEHDGAYKNEEGFRYHARELASSLARAHGCPLVLGSATPALETRHAAERGEIHRLVLSHRIGGRPLPAVQIVDLAEERARAPRGRKILLSSALHRALARTLAHQGQAILFLNRRGFSTQIMCFACNTVERCKHCDISLVYHAAQERLLCHYCDYGIPPPDTCSDCGSSEVALLGVGTERLVEEVRSHFPDARIARLDRDTATRRGSTERLLGQFARREIDVIVGTQMVAKGHDFPGVRLVGVVNADLGLHLPDFRAAERTFQLLTQVAGRAGRGGTPGRVIIQSSTPEHYAIRPVLSHDYETFYGEELAHRKALGYPPFGQLAHAVLSSPDEHDAEQAAGQLVESLRATEGSRNGALEILGPAPCPIARLRGRYRFQILIKAKEFEAVHEAARTLQRAATRLKRGVRTSVDVQPLHML